MFCWIILLTDWFAQKNIDNTVMFVTIFITGSKQVCSITDEFVFLQSGSVFYERAKLTAAQYKLRFRPALNKILKPYDLLLFKQLIIITT